MKKFLVILAILFGVQYGAWADVGNDWEVKIGNFMCGQYVADNAYYDIYFETAKDAKKNIGVKELCETQMYQQIGRELRQEASNIDYLVVIAGADQEGDSKGFNNTELAASRLNYVKGQIIPEGIDIRDHVTGSQDAKAKRKDGPQPGARVVRIYIIWRLPKCDTVKADKDKYALAFDKCRITQSKELTNCLDGKSLTPTDDEKLWKFLLDSISKCSELKQVAVETGLEVEIAYQKVSRFFNGLGLSVWRDRDGNFNTARLASDSIAAVVLGTAGGLITSKLVKKNQIKKGFEDLNCSIGGQRVATFGDEFSVGLQ